jgi:antitoxin ParD1/3/4
MAKNTSILLGDYFDKFINHQVQSGRFSFASEVLELLYGFLSKKKN